MSIEESIQQIETLIEAWQLDEADLNQTDINAMQVLLKENQELNQKYLNAVADYETTMSELQELKKQIEEVEFIVGLRQKRNLISKFDKEYDEEDKKKNPNRDYAGIMPDAEEVYKRYYSMKKQQKEFVEYLENEKDRIARECSQIYEDSLGKTRLVNEDIFNELNTILSKYIEIIGE